MNGESQQSPDGTPGFKAQLDRYLLGLARASMQGGAVAVKAFFGAAGANALGLGVAALDLKQTGAVFLVGAGYHFFDYLAANPLPVDAAPSGAAISDSAVIKNQ